LRGAVLGLVSAILFALVVGIATKQTLNCLPQKQIIMLNCLEPTHDSKCPRMCSLQSETIYNAAIYLTMFSFVFLPVMLGIKKLYESDKLARKKPVAAL
jgi:hypothetical protein